MRPDQADKPRRPCGGSPPRPGKGSPRTRKRGSRGGRPNRGFHGRAALLPIAIALAAAACGPGKAAGLARFESAFREANAAATPAAMRALYCLDGATERVLDQLDFTLGYELGLPLRSIEFERIAALPEAPEAATRDGAPYRPNLRPEYEMRVVYDLPERMTSTYRLGRDAAGEWRILLLVPAGVAAD